MRYIGFFIAALTIDVLQFLLGIAIIVVFTVLPGTSAGAVTGYGLGDIVGIPETGAVVGGAIGSLFNAPASVFGTPVGIAVQTVLSFTISATFGTGLVVLLIFCRMMKPLEIFTIRRFPLMLAELLPIIPALPFYTALVTVCALKDMKRRAVPGAASKILPLVRPASFLSTLNPLQQSQSPESVARPQEAPQRPRISDIRPRASTGADYPPVNKSYAQAV